MNISYAELFLLVWAILATFLAVTRGAELRGIKGFVWKMVEDPAIYNQLRNKVKGVQS